MPPKVSPTFPRCSQGRHGAGVMNGKPACQMLLPSSVLSSHLEHKIKHTNDREKRKEDTRRKTKPLKDKKKSYFVWRSALFRVCSRIQYHKRKWFKLQDANPRLLDGTAKECIACDRSVKISWTL